MRVVDLFCGAGGFSVGMKQAGHSIVGAFDREPAPLAVHHANHPDVPWSPRFGLHQKRCSPFRRRKPITRGADLAAVLEWVPEISLLEPDVIVGGPPCQPWSPSGKRLGDGDPLAILTIAYATITAAVQPRYFFMENVPGLAKSETFDKAVTILRNAGYGLTIRTLSTMDYGSVQKRTRLIVAGCKGETAGWLNEFLDEPHWNTETTIGDVLGEEFGPLLFRRGHYKGARRSFHRVDEACPTLTSTSARGNAGPYRLRAADIKILQSVGDGIAVLGRGREYRPTVGDIIQPDHLPIPDLRQFCQLAGFPGDYRWDVRFRPMPKEDAKRPPAPRWVGKTHFMKMIGNSVPPPFARALGECLNRYHTGRPVAVQSREEPIFPDFREWLREKKKLDDAAVAAVCRLAERARAIVSARELDTASDELDAFENIASKRRSLASDPDFGEMRRAMLLIYECSLNADGLGLEDLDPYGYPDLDDVYDDVVAEEAA